MAAIAEGFVVGLPATAQGDQLLALGQRETISLVVRDLEVRRQHQRTIFPATNDQEFRHWISSTRGATSLATIP
jgi:hypothetical protein